MVGEYRIDVVVRRGRFVDLSVLKLFLPIRLVGELVDGFTPHCVGLPAPVEEAVGVSLECPSPNVESFTVSAFMAGANGSVNP